MYMYNTVLCLFFELACWGGPWVVGREGGGVRTGPHPRAVNNRLTDRLANHSPQGDQVRGRGVQILYINSRPVV